MTLEDAQKHLAEIVRSLSSAGEVMILESDQPVARLSPVGQITSLRDLRPRSVGAILRPYPSAGDDLLDEMLDSRP